MDGMKFRGYKSFSDKWITIEEFSKITVLIGRNNSGKSSCIDIIEALTDPYTFHDCQQRGLELQLDYTLKEDEVRAVFPESTFGGDILARNFWEFGRRYVGEKTSFIVETENTFGSGDQQKFRYLWNSDTKVFSEEYKRHWERFEHCDINPWTQYKFRRLAAERDILPEMEDEEESLQSTGVGASNLVRKIVNYNDRDEKLIEKTLLNALNTIIYPDSHYSGIRVQQKNVEGKLYWEIYLVEGDKRFPLSRMGSGLKTIILVLLNLLVIPEIDKRDSTPIIYAFEELENNLHPALQRRLFDYLYEYSRKNNVMIFLTTHSHIAINAFSEKEEAQILHVVREDNVSTLHKIDNYFLKSELLNDLDIRASDLLQTNGIIWVEGPSDRIYVKRWLELAGMEFEEGRHYQFMYYGGRLLSHYSTQEEDDMINILLTNRNTAILIDSDKRTSHARINATKKRIQQEFSDNNMFCWITVGKEIENYVPQSAISKVYPRTKNKQCGQYELFPEYIKSVCPGFSGRKIAFAKKVCEHITEDNWDVLGVRKNINTLGECIKRWNRL